MRVYTRSTASRDNHIRLLLTGQPASCAILSGFRLTAVCNICSWNRAYALFPLPTFIYRKAYLLGPMNSNFAKQIAKAARAGLKVQDILWHEEQTINHPIRKQRRVADRLTWTIDFPTHGITCEPKSPDFVLGYSHFTLSLRKDNVSGLDYYDLRAALLKSETFRYQYTYGKGPDEDSEPSWVKLLDDRTNRLTLLALRHLHPANRPANYHNICSDPKRVNEWPLAGFAKPDSWTYWDEEVPGWYQAWEQERGRQVPADEETKLETLTG